MRVALYDADTLTALTTIEFPNALLLSPTPWSPVIALAPRLEVTVHLEVIKACLRSVNMNHSFGWVARAAGPKSNTICRLPFFGDIVIEGLQPQHIPEAQRAIRAALQMGEA